jgi:hypothetical protein
MIDGGNWVIIAQRCARFACSSIRNTTQRVKSACPSSGAVDAMLISWQTPLGVDDDASGRRARTLE